MAQFTTQCLEAYPESEGWILTNPFSLEETNHILV
jgi:hypothetical protein